ncbi:hypothetical protein H2203_001161 [Taxawa tesnikishii (nom. ined.)]|nr:hypothetical protein H2203_001161 [Dothideales sp. JES 119]
MRKVVEKITVRDSTPVEPAEPSPTNSLSLGVTDNMAPQTSMTATANGTSAGTSFVAEPASMTDAPSQPGVSAPSTGAEEGRDNKAFTYPGPASADTQEGEEDREEEEEDMSEQQQRRVSEPSRKRTHLETPQDAGRAVYRQHSSTYPPIAGRMMRGDMGPPSTVMASSSGATSPVSSSNIMSPSAGSSYAGSHFYAPSTGSGVPPPTQDAHRLGVTEQPGLRNRSPSLTQQFQQAHFGRGSGRGTPPILQPGQYSSHPPPPTHLPSLPGLGPAATTRPTMQTVPLAPSMLAHQQNASTTSLNQISSNPSSMSSHGGHQQNSSGNSMREVLGPDSQDLWNYIRSLEGRFSRMQDEYELRISRLQEDVISLKGQLNYPPR